MNKSEDQEQKERRYYDRDFKSDAVRRVLKIKPGLLPNIKE